MYSWEVPIRKVIELQRDYEVVKMLKASVLNNIGWAFGGSIPIICVYLMSMLSTSRGVLLAPNKVYTSLMILNFVKIWGVYLFHSGRIFIVSTRVMKKRLEDVLLIKDVLSIEETQKVNAKHEWESF